MNKDVFVCFKGANIPCMAKANTSKRASAEMMKFCRKNKGANIIPAYITGHNSIYEWRCQDGIPKIIKQVFYPDKRDFISEFWYKIEINKITGVSE